MSSMQSQPQTFLSRWAWLLFPLLAFGAVAATFGLLKYVGPKLPFILLGAVIAIGLLWILVSSLSPAKADRTCPECGEQGLERLDPNTTRGVVCSSCGYVDPDISAWYLAEDETLLEEIVLSERAQKRATSNSAESQDTTRKTTSAE